VSAKNFTTQQCFSLKNNQQLSFAFYKSKGLCYSLQIFQQNIFIFTLILIKLVFE